MTFGQLVIGPPGAGKSTYCAGLQHYFELTGRKAAVVNLDPAAESLPYAAAVDVRQLVAAEDVQRTQGLGPNGSLVWCMQHLADNFSWLADRLRPLAAAGAYLLLDCPGQAELFTLHGSLRGIAHRLCAPPGLESLNNRGLESVPESVDGLGLRLVAVHLTDSHLCGDGHKYLAALLSSLAAMLHLSLPHVNCLSKCDLLRAGGALDHPLAFYARPESLARRLAPPWPGAESAPGAAFARRFARLTAGLCDLAEDYSLVDFALLDVCDKEAVAGLVALCDRANGYVFSGLESAALARGDAPGAAAVLFDHWAAAELPAVSGGGGGMPRMSPRDWHGGTTRRSPWMTVLGTVLGAGGRGGRGEEGGRATNASPGRPGTGTCRSCGWCGRRGGSSSAGDGWDA